MSRRSDVLELAVLGLLHEHPMHGYELRKRLSTVLGTFRALSYGSLYPCLRGLVTRGEIAEAAPGTGEVPPLTGRRARIVYQLTAEGKDRFAALLGDTGPAAWDDDAFGVRFAFFARTDAATRLRILEGRRTRMQERLEAVRQAAGRTRSRLDSYTLELQRHGLEAVEHEVRWLDGLIASERSAAPPATGAPPGATSSDPAPPTDREPGATASSRTSPHQ